MQSSSSVVRGALAVIAWLVATVLAGTVAWIAVSRLARPAGATELRPLSPADVRSQLAQPGPPAPSGPGRTSRPTDQRHAGGPGPGVARLAAPPKGVSRSWQLAGGVVGVVCRGGTAHLLYAAPLNGWAYRLETWSRIISVEFTRAAQTAGLTRAQTSGLRADCVKGVPARLAGDDHEAPTQSGDHGD